MPSKQSDAVRRRWEAARLAMTQPDVEGPDDESRGDLTAEPREVDYTEVEAGGRPAMWLVPKRARTDRVLLCLHGGGFVSGSIYTHRKMFGHLAKATGARALLVGYRLLPEGGGYPVPVDEGEAAYRWLLEQGTEPGHIAFAGDSVGGWLAITVQLRARAQGLIQVGGDETLLDDARSLDEHARKAGLDARLDVFPYRAPGIRRAPVPDHRGPTEPRLRSPGDHQRVYRPGTPARKPRRRNPDFWTCPPCSNQF